VDSPIDLVFCERFKEYSLFSKGITHVLCRRHPSNFTEYIDNDLRGLGIETRQRRIKFEDDDISLVVTCSHVQHHYQLEPYKKSTSPQDVQKKDFVVAQFFLRASLQILFAELSPSQTSLHSKGTHK
jgi:hypothetical protein